MTADRALPQSMAIGETLRCGELLVEVDSLSAKYRMLGLGSGFRSW
jgi:hypothetical protein